MTAQLAGMGAIPFDQGVAFRVWAPNAQAVTVKGDFNGWSEDANPLTDEGNVPVTAAWRIHDLVATTPHGRLQGSGLWGTPGGARAAAARTASSRPDSRK